MRQSAQFFQTANANGTPSGTQLDGVVAGSSFAVSFTTAGQYCGGAESACIVFGSPDAAADGAVKVQVSVDESANNTETPDANLTHWVDMPFYVSAGTVAASVAVAGAGSLLLDIPRLSARWLRLVYTRTSGTAKFSARCQLKGSSS